MERGDEPGDLFEASKHLFHRLLLIETVAALQRASGAWREKSLPLVDLLAKRAIQLKQPFHNGQPLRQSVDAWWRKSVALRPRSQRMIGPIDPEVGAGVTRKLQQRSDDVAREHVVERT